MIKQLIQKSMKILLVLVALTVFSASATPAVIIEEAQNATVGSTIPMNIVLSGAEKGLSGYNITVTLANASAAEIVSVDFSKAFFSSTGSLPADSVWLKALDLSGQTRPGDIVLAIVNVRIDSPGTVKLNTNVIGMDYSDGSRVFPPTANPTVTVTPVIQVNVTPSTQTNVPSVTSTIGNTPETTPAASSTPSVVSTPDKTIQKATTTGKTEKGDNSPKTSGFQVILFMICMSVVFVCRKKYS